jgi:hypothetical protein
MPQITVLEQKKYEEVGFVVSGGCSVPCAELIGLVGISCDHMASFMARTTPLSRPAYSGARHECIEFDVVLVVLGICRMT